MLRKYIIFNFCDESFAYDLNKLLGETPKYNEISISQFTVNVPLIVPKVLLMHVTSSLCTQKITIIQKTKNLFTLQELTTTYKFIHGLKKLGMDEQHIVICHQLNLQLCDALKNIIDVCDTNEQILILETVKTEARGLYNIYVTIYVTTCD